MHDLWPHLTWPWPPYNTQGVKGYKWHKFDQNRGIGAKLRFDLNMTFDPTWPDPDPLLHSGGSRAISDASLVKIGVAVLDLLHF